MLFILEDEMARKRTRDRCGRIVGLELALATDALYHQRIQLRTGVRGAIYQGKFTDIQTSWDHTEFMSLLYRRHCLETLRAVCPELPDEIFQMIWDKTGIEAICDTLLKDIQSLDAALYAIKLQPNRFQKKKAAGCARIVHSTLEKL